MGYEDALKEARSILEAGDYDAATRAEAVLTAFAESTDDANEKGMALRTAAVYASKAGKVNCAMDRFREAEGLIDEPIQRMKLYECWGVVTYNTGRKDMAPMLARCLRTALDACADVSHPAMPYAYTALARLQMMLGELTDALTLANTAVTLATVLASGRAEAYSAVSAIKEALGDIEGAMEALEQSMTFTSSRACLMEAHANMSCMAIEAGDTKTAGHHLRAAVDFPNIHDRLILVKVYRAIAQLVKIDPATAAILLERLAAHLETGKKPRGVRR